MIDEKIIFLTYYYDQADYDSPVLGSIINTFCPVYLPFNLYLYKPLKAIFSQVVLYDFLKRRAEIGFRAMNAEIIALVKSEHPKYLFWTSFSYDVDRETLEEIRAAGTIVIGWFFDDDWRFNNYSKYWAHYLDYAVTNSLGAVPKYERLGAKVIQTIPNTGVAIDPDWTHLVEKHDVTFVGSSKFANRGLFVDGLKECGLPIEIFGEGSSGYVSFEQMLEIFRTSKINLNFSIGGGYYWDRQVKGRIFQVCMAGGFLLTENTPGIEKYYKIDKEIVCFENSAELIEKISYYLSHDDERRAIARAGWEKARREHTSAAMVSKVFNQIESDLVLFPVSSRSRAIKLSMPPWIRRFPSEYHLEWAYASLQENSNNDNWQESLTLAFRNSVFNIWVWYFALIGIIPFSARQHFFNFYRFQAKLRVLFLRRLQSISQLRLVCEPLLRKLW